MQVQVIVRPGEPGNESQIIGLGRICLSFLFVNYSLRTSKNDCNLWMQPYHTMLSTSCGRPIHLQGGGAYETVYLLAFRSRTSTLQFTSRLVDSFEFMELNSDYSLAVVIYSHNFCFISTLRRKLTYTRWGFLSRYHCYTSTDDIDPRIRCLNCHICPR